MSRIQEIATIALSQSQGGVPLRYAQLFQMCFSASGEAQPMEQFYETMFAGFYDKENSQPSAGTVSRVARGVRYPSRRMLRHYRDPQNPRCPSLLQEDLTALLDTCFADAFRSRALRQALEHYLTGLSTEERMDVKEIMNGDLAHDFTCVTWAAITGDCDEASY